MNLHQGAHGLRQRSGTFYETVHVTPTFTDPPAFYLHATEQKVCPASRPRLLRAFPATQRSTGHVPS